MYGHAHGAIAAGGSVGRMVAAPRAQVNAARRSEVGEMVADPCFCTSLGKEKIARDRNCVTSLISFRFTRNRARTRPVTAVHSVVKGELAPVKCLERI